MCVSSSTQADGMARVVCIDPHDSELVARITGQTRDLAIQLTWVDEPVGAAAEAQELQHVADRHAADVVVVVQPNAAGGFAVYVYDAAQHQLRARDAPRPPGVERLAASTMAETAALIVRGELSAALSGHAQTRVQAVVAESAGRTPTTAPEAAPPAKSRGRATSEQRPTRTAEEVARRGHRLSLATGVRAELPGAQKLLAGPWLGARLALARVEFGLLASTTLPAALEHDAVGISLRRHALGGEALGLLDLGAHVELGVGAGAGIALYARDTRLLGGGGLAKTPASTSWSATFGPLFELRWRFVRSVGLAARLGVDVNSRPMSFKYEKVGGSGDQVELARFARYEPWAAAALFVDIWQ
jgi:hypothetical protein